MDKWSNKYWWWIASHNGQATNSGYFYAPYIPHGILKKKEGIIRMGSDNV